MITSHSLRTNNMRTDGLMHLLSATSANSAKLLGQVNFLLNSMSSNTFGVSSC